METGMTFAALESDPSERFVLLRRQLGVTSFGLNQLFFRPGGRGRIHTHTHQEEVYLVLSGTLTLLAADGFERDLDPGELVRIAPGVRRQLVNRQPEPLTVLAIGGATEHQGRDGEAYPDWDTPEPVSPRDLPLPEDLPID